MMNEKKRRKAVGPVALVSTARVVNTVEILDELEWKERRDTLMAASSLTSVLNDIRATRTVIRPPKATLTPEETAQKKEEARIRKNEKRNAKRAEKKARRTALIDITNENTTQLM